MVVENYVNVATKVTCLFENHIVNVQRYFKVKGIGGGKTLFSQLNFVLKSFIQATRCFLQISKIQSNF